MQSDLAQRYEVGAALGSGGMASVVAAHDRLLDRPVAVKLLHPHLADDPAVRERFLGEARAAARLTHPNAVAVFDVGTDGAQPFIVMELVDGETLADRIRREGALPVDEAADIACAVLAALHAAHAVGLVHRDVKPGNVLLPRVDGVKLADFGIAKSLDAASGLTMTGQVLGTPSYMAPEQLAGAPASPSSDLYSAGVLLYEALCGRPPFHGDTPMSVAVAHQRDLPAPLDQRRPDVPAGLAAAVHRALAKDPSARHADAAAMRRALLAARPAQVSAPLSAQPTAEPTAVLPVAPPTGSRVDTVGPALAGLLLIAFVATLVGFAVSERARRGAEGEVLQQAGGAPPDEAAEPVTEGAGDQPPAEPEAGPDAALPPPAPPPAPGTLPELIEWLEGQPDQWGEKGKDLRQKLREVAKEDGGKQAEKARDLIDDMQGWVADGELDAGVGAVAIDVLTPLAVHGDGDDD